MGLEAYLFKLNFKKMLTAYQISSTLRQLGFKRAKSDIFTMNWELVSDKGIIECQLFNLIPFLFYIPTPKSLYFRFCLSNPHAVIEESMSLLTTLNSLLGGSIVDMQYHKVFRINNPIDVKEVNERILDRKKSVDVLFGKVDRPIRCNDVWNVAPRYLEARRRAKEAALKEKLK